MLPYLSILIIAIGASSVLAKHAKQPGPLYEQPPACNHDEVSIRVVCALHCANAYNYKF